MALKMLHGSTLKMGGNHGKKVLCFIFWVVVYVITYLHWDSDRYWPIHWKFYERYNYSLIPTVFRDIYDKAGWMMSDVVWYLVDNGPRDLAVTVWFTGMWLLAFFLKFRSYSDTIKKCVVAAFFLFIFGWLCYCFW